MPAFEIRDRYQPAVLWPATGAFDDYAVPIVGPPVEILVRWHDGKTEVLSPDGQTITLDGTAIVDQMIPIGSRMWQGYLVDWYAQAGSGGDDNEVREVKMWSGVADIKNRNARFKVGLMRWRSKT